MENLPYYQYLKTLFWQYAFWLASISVLCLILEIFFSRRKGQKIFRQQFGQDLFFLVFNGHFFGLILAKAMFSLSKLFAGFYHPEFLQNLEKLKLLAPLSWPAQFLIFLIIKDFLEWLIHNLLHRINALWEVHKLHHSITEMDWIGNFRFHFLEVIVYKSLTWLPLLPLAPDGSVLLAVAVFATFIGHLNHANLNWDYGPLKFIFNSPRMHLWHHDIKCHFRSGQNFAIVFSTWDWIFRTIYYPVDTEAPEKLGFHGIKTFPEKLSQRLLYPFSLFFSKFTKGSE